MHDAIGKIKLPSKKSVFHTSKRRDREGHGDGESEIWQGRSVFSVWEVRNGLLVWRRIGTVLTLWFLLFASELQLTAKYFKKYIYIYINLG